MKTTATLCACLALALLAGFGCSGSSVNGDDATTDTMIIDWNPPPEADALDTNDGLAKPDAVDVSDASEGVDAADDAKVEAEQVLEIEVEKGGFGFPCTGPDDCLSGYCIEGYDGWICTELCLDTCANGYSCKGVVLTAPDTTFLCLPLVDRLCEPCSSDLQCSGGRCAELEGGKYCLTACGDACPDTYVCADVLVRGASEKLCRPANGSCVCNADSLGLEKSCKVSDQQQTCYGVRFCEDAGWGDCHLPEEICDGKDNDCNGVVDDGFLDAETGLYLTAVACGTCQQNCTAKTYTFGHGACDATGAGPHCVLSCEDGHFDLNGNPLDGCECAFASALDLPDGQDQNCDGVDGEISNAIFVAKDGTDGNEGSWGAPVLTIQAGLDLALGLRDVYVATGVYEEMVTLRAGVHVYGGYSADFRVRNVDLYQTVILGGEPSPLAPAAVVADGIGADGATLDGFTVFGGDASTAADSSVAVLVRDCGAALAIAHCRIVAGNGADGKRGVDGTDGTDGTAATPGKDSYDIAVNPCTSSLESEGGLGGSQACGQADVSGGSGGRAVCPDFDEDGTPQPKASPYHQFPKAAESGSAGVGSGFGAGGIPGYDALLWSGYQTCGVCNVPRGENGEWLPMYGADGKDGADGTLGGAGEGCTQTGGSVVDGVWHGLDGTAGGFGDAGAGGGGGGAGGGVETWGCEGVDSALFSDVAGSGGGGGSGACGGSGGAGGTAGGGAFAILLVYSTSVAGYPAIVGNRLETGRGGSGGDGGSGGVGGVGGDGKAGGGDGDGTVAAWCAGGGGRGGQGGNGGHGGGGGGGCGGVSYGFYLSAPLADLSPDYLDQNEVTLKGAGGFAGKGGKSLGLDGTDASEGAHAAANF